MSYDQQELKDLKENLRKRNLDKRRANLKKRLDANDPIKILEAIEGDLKSLNKHIKILKRALR